MNENMMNLLIYGGALLLMGSLPAIFMFVRAQQQSSTWKKVAEQHGLTFESTGGESRISGTYRGRGISADVVVRGKGKNSSPHTFVQVKTKGASAPEFEIEKLEFPVSVENRKRYREFESYRDMVDIGDPDIDRHYAVKTSEIAKVQSLLSSGSIFRHSIESLFKLMGSGTATTGQGLFTFDVYGRQTNQVKFQKMLDGICDAAEVLERS